MGPGAHRNGARCARSRADQGSHGTSELNGPIPHGAPRSAKDMRTKPARSDEERIRAFHEKLDQPSIVAIDDATAYWLEGEDGRQIGEQSPTSEAPLLAALLNPRGPRSARAEPRRQRPPMEWRFRRPSLWLWRYRIALRLAGVVPVSAAGDLGGGIGTSSGLVMEWAADHRPSWSDWRRASSGEPIVRIDPCRRIAQ